MDLYFASPAIFFGGFVLLDTKWPVTRVMGVCMAFGALAIACVPET